ncbi:beta strand repeat-containing protein [Nitrosomonas ureae]|uniref:Hemolysin-type calcium-binding repeat-containing protein n=1 Tax=Nitrosomonas ureae TaxID=44577 RepID=A0A1H5WYS1_9PROT|nr:calcium-binding protein [Nitrosomonas ureae]SEG04186.1 hypothetical protein SAMN05216334_12218 [Nitrosomonas ureae]
MNDRQLEIVQTVVAMFNAAPGAHYLNAFVSFLGNTGSSVKELASILAQTDVFKQSLYSDTLSHSEFAHQFVNNTVGLLVNNKDKLWAASEIEKMLEAGASRGDVLHQAATALASVDPNNIHWGAAAQRFNHKIEAAAFYSIDQGGPATNLSVLQRVIEEITGDLAATKALLAAGATGKVIDGYVKEAFVFADLDGNRLHDSGEKNAITDALGNFSMPGIDGFGELIVTGGIDIATGRPFEGGMTAPAGATLINPFTTLVSKLVQADNLSVEIANAKILSSLGINGDINLLHFDPIKETVRTDLDETAANTALVIHVASTQIQTIIGQTAALLSGSGISPDEAIAIDWAYDALAAILNTATEEFSLTSNHNIAQVIRNAAFLSDADDAILIKAAILLDDATQTITNLSQKIINISQSNVSKLKMLSNIAALQIVAEDIEIAMQSGAAQGNIKGTVINATGTQLTSAIAAAGTKIGDVNGDGKSDARSPSSSASSTKTHYLATNATAFSGTAANDILSVSTASTWTSLVMTAVILDGGGGTNTLSVQDGSSIALAIVINFPNLLFDATGAIGTTNVTMSAAQNQSFTGTVTAPGTGGSGEEITIVGDGTVTTLANIENYTIEDDATDARTVAVIHAATHITAASSSDAITFSFGALTYTGTISGDTTVDDIISLDNGADISGGTITNVAALTLASGASVRLSAVQNQSFTGTVTAPGTGGSGEEITIVGDGTVTTLANIENYTIEDDATDARTVAVIHAATHITAVSSSDAITFSFGALTYTGTISGDTTVDDIISLDNGADISGGTITNVAALTLAAGASVRLSAAQNQSFTGTVTAPGTGGSGENIIISGNGNITVLSNIESYELGDDTSNARTLTLGSGALTLIANNADDTITVNATALAQNVALTLGAGASSMIISNLAGDIVASNLTGTLTITTANAADNNISITTGSSATSVNVAAGAASNNISIDATSLTNNTSLTITSSAAAAGSVSVVGLVGNLTVSNPTSGIISVAMTDNMVDDEITVVAGASNLIVSNVADGDTVTITGFTGSTLTGTIAGTTGKFNITAGTATNNMITGTGDDSFTFAAGSGLTSADTINGGEGIDTVALTGNTAVAATNFDNVSNIEVITVANTTGAVAITTKDALVAAGAVLVLQADSLTTGILTFNGAAETGAAFTITGGGGNDSITSGAGNDTLAGSNGNDSITAGLGDDTLSGDAGNDTLRFAAVSGLTHADTVALTGNTDLTASTDFDNVRNIEAITLGNTNTAVTITTQDALVAAGATLTLTNAANSGVLTFNGSAETDGAFTITGGTGSDSITGGAQNDTLAGGTGNDTLSGGTGNDIITSGAGTDSITANAGADTISLGSSANDNIRQTTIYSSVSDGAAAGANSGADTIIQFDANANTATDDLIRITDTFKSSLDDDNDNTLDYSVSNGTDAGNQAISGGANQEATVLLDAELEVVLADFTTSGLANLIAELDEEVDFTTIATGEESLFLMNFSTTQTALALYTAGSGGNDVIDAADIQILGIVTHNDGTGLAANNLTF